MSLKDIRTYGWGTRRSIGLLSVLFVAAGIVYAWPDRPKSEQADRFSAANQAPANGNRCPAAEVSSIKILTQYPETGIPFDAAPIITIEPTVTAKPVKIVVLGPVLGSMDSTDVKTHLVCTTKGFALTATITRSADYHGATAKNVIWRPRIEIAVVLGEPEVIFRATWKLRLTTGSELDHGQTGSYPEQTYPVILLKTLTHN
jgi:hypothetical protein